MTSIKKLLDTIVQEGGSDLHLSVGSHPIIRVAGSLVPLVQEDILTPEATEAMLKEILPEGRWAVYKNTQTVDFSYMHGDKNRFRINAYIVQGTTTIAMRLIPRDIRTFTDLNLPPVLEVFTQRTQGFFLVVGPVGLGKSTTLATIIDTLMKRVPSTSSLLKIRWNTCLSPKNRLFISAKCILIHRISMQHSSRPFVRT